MTPTVDVIVPCYNYGRMLEASVESVCSQEGVAVRVLIMDDASTDETENVGSRLSAHDRRVEYRRHEKNCGHIATYNEALRLVTGDYCLILSPDDLLTPGALSRAVRVMEAEANVGLVYGRDIPFRTWPPAEEPRATDRYRVMGYEEFLAAACQLGHTGIQSPTAIVRTSVHRVIGMYRPELPHSGDTEIWLRMAAFADVAVVDADQAFRRLHQHNMSLSYSPLARLEEQRKAFDTHFESARDPNPRIAALQAVAHGTIAESAFWQAARAFEEQDDRRCDEFLAFAASLAPAIEQSRHWRRLQWKRRLGRPATRMLSLITAGRQG
jgi:hypothetical protein